MDRRKTVRLISAVMSMILCLGLFSGCTNDSGKTTEAPSPQPSQSVNQTASTSETTAPTESVSNSENTTESQTETSGTTEKATEKATEKTTEAKTTAATTAKAEMSKKAKESLKALRKSIGKKEKAVGIAFIGYVNDKNSRKQIRSFIKKSDTAKAYPFISEIPSADYSVNGGAELYTIVPQNEKATVTVYKSKPKDNGKYKDDTKNPLYKGKPGEAVILCCNISEIYSDVYVTVTNGSEKVGIRPFLSLENGRLPKSKKFFDFSVYGEEREVTDLDVQIGYEILSGADEVRYYMNKGMSLLYMNEHNKIDGRDCMIYALGTEKEDRFVREFYYGVCDNLIYAYDASTDSWSVLGSG